MLVQGKHAYFLPLSALHSLDDKAITFSQETINNIRQLDSTEMKSPITLQSQKNKNKLWMTQNAIKIITYW